MKDWLSRPLRALAQVDLGRQRSPEHADGPHMVPYLRAANVVDGELDLSDVKEMNFTPQEQRFFSLRRGDILVTEGSGSLRTVGASAVWWNELPGTVCFQNTLLRIRPRSCNTDPRFLEWWCRFAYADGLFASIGAGANIFHLSAERVRALPVRCPQRPEQNIIADFLEAETTRIDALIAKKKELVRVLESRFAILVRQTLLGDRKVRDPLDIRSDDGIDPGRVPVRLAWRFRFGSGTTPQSDNTQYYGDRGIPWMVTGDLRDGYVDSVRRCVTSEALSKYPALAVHPAGSIVVAMYGATIGRLARMRIAATVNQACCVISPMGEDLPEFIFYWLLGFKSELIERGRGAGQPNISQELLRSIRVALPPLGEQHEIVHKLDRQRSKMQDLTRVLEKQISLLGEHRQALITAAVTGEMDVPGVPT